MLQVRSSVRNLRARRPGFEYWPSLWVTLGKSLLLPAPSRFLHLRGGVLRSQKLNSDAGFRYLSTKVQLLGYGPLWPWAPPYLALWGEREAHDVITALGKRTRSLAKETQCSARNQMENGLMVQMILCVWG